MSQKELRQRRREYTRQFYKNNRLAFLGALCFVVLMCLVQLSVSWLLQVVTDLIGGGSQYSLSQALGYTLLCVGVMGLSYALDRGLLERYDCVLALKNGRIAEAGTYAQLMAEKGYFYSLFTVSQ